MECDVLILGSSFSGSLLAWILAARGMRVLVIDRGRHPRFAIGESSTPAADLILADLAARHRLPELAPLARWGSWQATYPDLGCGKKRGFSYFHHRLGEPFRDTPDHAASLLVAASATDAGSDTHWLRADVDTFFCASAARAGAIVREECELAGIERGAGRWRVRFADARDGESGAREQAHAPFLIDATGGGGALADVLGMTSLDDTLLTRRGAIYSHFRGIGSWDGLQEAAGNVSTTSPFRSDDAAQHHCIDGGWMWILRFRDDLASVGFVQPTDVCRGWEAGGAPSRDAAWRGLVSAYPSLAELFEGSRAVRPLGLIPRMSRLWSRASGEGFAMLPTTAGFVDPLHSTGIAHALSGVQRLAELLLAESFDEEAWQAYGVAVIDEVTWIDQLVSACYAVLPDFDRFRLSCTLFFLATVAAERGYARGETTASQGFLAARHTPLRTALAAARRDLVAGGKLDADRLRDRLAPFDPVGLLDPAARHRFAHTAVDK
jgi:FADH2 O2-dependent halogenase